MSGSGTGNSLKLPRGLILATFSYLGRCILAPWSISILNAAANDLIFCNNRSRITCAASIAGARTGVCRDYGADGLRSVPGEARRSFAYYCNNPGKTGHMAGSVSSEIFMQFSRLRDDAMGRDAQRRPGKRVRARSVYLVISRLSRANAKRAEKEDQIREPNFDKTCRTTESDYPTLTTIENLLSNLKFCRNCYANFRTRLRRFG